MSRVDLDEIEVDKAKKKKMEVGSSGCKPHVGDWLGRLLAASLG
jgi:hypothetical protein